MRIWIKGIQCSGHCLCIYSVADCGVYVLRRSVGHGTCEGQSRDRLKHTILNSMLDDMLYCCCVITAQTEYNYHKANKDLLCSDKWLICWIHRDKLRGASVKRSRAAFAWADWWSHSSCYCYFEIPLGCCELFILPAYTVLVAHKFLNDSCDNIVAGWRWLHSIQVDKKELLKTFPRNSLLSHRQAEQLSLLFVVWLAYMAE